MILLLQVWQQELLVCSHFEFGGEVMLYARCSWSMFVEVFDEFSWIVAMAYLEYVIGDTTLSKVCRGT